MADDDVQVVIKRPRDPVTKKPTGPGYQTRAGRYYVELHSTLQELKATTTALIESQKEVRGLTLQVQQLTHKVSELTRVEDKRQRAVEGDIEVDIEDDEEGAEISV